MKPTKIKPTKQAVNRITTVLAQCKILTGMYPEAKEFFGKVQESFAMEFAPDNQVNFLSEVIKKYLERRN